jgi:hypothetical protein
MVNKLAAKRGTAPGRSRILHAKLQKAALLCTILIGQFSDRRAKF